MTIKSLIIHCVESQYTQEYIANVFWKQRIAKVSSITLIPYINKSEMYSVAYIYINEWCDTEAAYNFIRYLNNPSKEARIIHYDDEWWPVQLISHNCDIYVKDYTIKFDSAYFNRNETAYNEEWLSKHPIKGIRNEYYSVEEALSRVWDLSDRIDYNCHLDSEESREIKHLKNELRIHEAVNKSSNVTLRAHQLGNRKYEEELPPQQEVVYNWDEVSV